MREQSTVHFEGSSSLLLPNFKLMKQINTILTQEQINLLKNKKGGTFSSTFVTNKNNKKRLVTKRQRVARKVQRNTDHTWTK